MPAAPNNLPQDVQHFVGREAELGHLAQLLSEGTRLVTVTGPAGIGKSSLVLCHGWKMARTEAWPGGVWFFDLTEASSLDETERALAGPAAAHPLRLVILDGVEQLLDATRAAVRTLLDGTRSTTVLVTSREPLGLKDERCLVLGKLGGPNGPPGPVRSDPAITLVLDHVRTLGLDPMASGASSQHDGALLKLVTRLDRNPLALELAARRLLVMSPSQLVRRLDERLSLLRSPLDAALRGARPLRSLSDAFERSWRLLSPAEQSVLTQLAVFAGPVGLEAIEAVLSVDGGEALLADAGEALLDRLDALVRKSLLQVGSDAAGGPRFDLGENLRAFVQARLEAEPPLLAAVVDRHARFFVGRAEHLAEREPSRATSQAQLVDELEAMLGVVDWALRPALLEAKNLARAAKVLLALHDTLQRRGPLSAAIERFETLLGHGELLPRELVVRLEAALGELLYLCGLGAQAARRLGPVLEGARRSGDAVGEALVVRTLGASFFYGRADVTPFELVRARATLEAAGYQTEAVDVLMRMARTLEQEGSPDQAIIHYREALEAAKRYGSRRQLASTELNLGVLLAQLGRMGEAQVLYRNALARSHELDDRALEAVVVANLGLAAFECHDDELARTRFEQALALAVGMDFGRVEAIARLHLGLLDQLAGRQQPAALNYQAALEVWHRAWPDPWDYGLLALGRAVGEALGGHEVAARRWVEKVMLATEGAPGPAGPALVQVAELAVARGGEGLEPALSAAREIVGPALRGLRGLPPRLRRLPRRLRRRPLPRPRGLRGLPPGLRRLPARLR